MSPKLDDTHLRLRITTGTVRCHPTTSFRAHVELRTGYHTRHRILHASQKSLVRGARISRSLALRDLPIQAFDAGACLAAKAGMLCTRCPKFFAAWMMLGAAQLLF